MRQATLSEVGPLWSRPQRVVMATGAYEGKDSIIVLGWKMMASGNPPAVAIGVGTTRFTHDLIQHSGEFVLAIPGPSIHKQVLYCGTHSGRNEDKFAGAGLTRVQGKIVQAPLIAECMANIECKVVGAHTFGDHTLFVGQMLQAWIKEDDEHQVLLIIGPEEGYERLNNDRRYPFGIVKSSLGI